MAMRTGVPILLWICCSSLLMGADMHLQTSADPYTQLIELNLPDERVNVNLSNPNVHYVKDAEGHMVQLSFIRVTTLYRIWFHPHEYSTRKERPRLIQQFEQVNGVWMLKGKVLELDVEGAIVRESQWDKGRMSGPLRIYDPVTKQLLEERFFDSSFPVGTWKQFYHNGNLASEITFPESWRDWKATYTAGLDNPTNLLEISLRRPIASVAAWYNQDGIKQAEHDYLLFYNGKDPIIQFAGNSRFYDMYGNLVSERNTPHGTGTVTHWFRSSGALRNVEETWIDGTAFKSASYQIPAPR